MMIKILTLIGVGGALGSIARFIIAQAVQRHFVNSGFPYGTLAVNVAGCLVIGIVYGLSERFNWMTPEWRVFLATGICGGFTTFSSFSYESIALIRDSEILYAGLNVAISVITGFAATFIGLSLTKL
ncbi:MAG: fluoride efflux transporter CrcB [Bacteroidia bacterium]|nr:fluoride efflux transporter CrcB [Bacteroidia bacterium]